MATFRFARAKDLSPDSSKVDNLVFAASRGAPTGTYAPNGETIIEIQYPTTDSSSTAVDEFDALYNALTVAFNGKEIDGDPLKGWDVLIQANKDTTKVIATTRVLDSKGWGYADLTVANLTPSAGAVLPYTLTLRLLKTQGNANGHGFTQVPTGVEGTTQKGRIKFVWEGTQLPYDTVWIGTETVTYTDVDILVGIHQEKDDSTDVATYTKGDATGSVAGAARLELYKWKSTTSKYVSQGAAAAPSGAGQLTYANLLVDTMYQVRARSVTTGLDVLNDTTVVFVLTGEDQVDTVGVLSGSGGPSAFAMKANNTTISGTILSVDGVTPVSKNTLVTIVATSDNIQPNKRGTDSTLVKTKADGTYAMTGLREGPYTVSVEDDAGKWSYLTTLKDETQKVNTAVKTVPIGGTEKAGTVVGNTDAHTATRDVEGYASTSVVNFAPHAMDTKIQGVVVNDRDSDFIKVDQAAGEALANVVITLTDDADNDGKIDSGEMQWTTTTDANGAYGFSALKEDNYIVSVDPTGLAGVTVLRSLDSKGDPLALVDVLTTAITGAGATLNQNKTRQVGNMNPPLTGVAIPQNDELPRWDYALNTAAADGGKVAGGGPNLLNAASTIQPVHFLHLFANGTLTGTVVDGAGKVQANIQVVLTQCATAVGFPVGATAPIDKRCSTFWISTKFRRQADTNATGGFSFSDLPEGVYELTTSGVETTPGATGYWLIRVKGNLDDVAADFTIT